jgi:hypothetical protein
MTMSTLSNPFSTQAWTGPTLMAFSRWRHQLACVRRLRRILRENGLSLTMFGLFFACLAGQSLTGWRQHNDEQRSHGRPPTSWSSYLTSGDFVEATFENWESEFFQMAALMSLSSVLVQKGSAQSNPLSGSVASDDSSRPRVSRRAPWPVRRGGWVKRLYARSLSLALAALFLISFTLHALGGRDKFNDEAEAHGQPTVGFIGYVTSSQFWFESFQNWQSEFLSIGALTVLSIYLRQSGSPESKPVEAPHAKTGTD